MGRYDWRAGETRIQAEALWEKTSQNVPQMGTGSVCEAGVDFLYAALIPTLPEAAGMAWAMAETGIPYIVCFTIQRSGTLIDGTLFAMQSRISITGYLIRRSVI